MEKEKNNNSPVLGYGELFDTGIIVDGTGTDLEEVDERIFQRKLKER